MAEKKGSSSKGDRQKHVDVAVKCVQGMDFMKDWNTWRKSVKSAIEEARSAGLKDEEIKTAATEVSNYLAERVCPATPEEEILKEMWQVSTEQERRALAGVLLKLMAQ